MQALGREYSMVLPSLVYCLVGGMDGNMLCTLQKCGQMMEGTERREFILLGSGVSTCAGVCAHVCVYV